MRWLKIPVSDHPDVSETFCKNEFVNFSCVQRMWKWGEITCLYFGGNNVIFTPWPISHIMEVLRSEL